MFFKKQSENNLKKGKARNQRAKNAKNKRKMQKTERKKLPSCGFHSFFTFISYNYKFTSLSKVTSCLFSLYTYPV